ncbi:MAG: acyl carrier protein [Rhizobiales bacterium]|nr:acyl carrier protein [Hyphomicrobiales bacterium]
MNESDVRSVIAESVPGFDVSTLGLESEFDKSGIDSLDHSVILLGLQEKHGLVVPDEDLDQANSIGKILAYAAKRSG